MVFGVLLRRERSARPSTRSSTPWGETDLIVMGEGSGTMPEDTLDDIKNVPGVRDAAGMVGGMFTRLKRDGSPVKGPKGQMLIAGYETRATSLRLPPRPGAANRHRPRGDGRAELGARAWLRRRRPRPRGRSDRPHGAADHRDFQAHEQPQRRRARLCGDAARGRGGSSTSRRAGCRSRSSRRTAARSPRSGSSTSSVPAPASRPLARCRPDSDQLAGLNASSSTSSRASRCSSAAF